MVSGLAEARVTRVDIMETTRGEFVYTVKWLILRRLRGLSFLRRFRAELFRRNSLGSNGTWLQLMCCAARRFVSRISERKVVVERKMSGVERKHVGGELSRYTNWSTYRRRDRLIKVKNVLDYLGICREGVGYNMEASGNGQNSPYGMFRKGSTLADSGQGSPVRPERSGHKSARGCRRRGRMWVHGGGGRGSAPERMWVPGGDGRRRRRGGSGSKRGMGGVGVGADVGPRGGRAEFVFPGSISLLGNRKRRGTGI